MSTQKKSIKKTQKEFSFKLKNGHTIFYDISDEKGLATSMLVFLNNSEDAYFYGKYRFEPIKFSTPTSFFYINCIKYKYYDDSEPLDYCVLSTIKESNKISTKNHFGFIQDKIFNIYQSGNKIINSLIESIEKSFVLSKTQCSDFDVSELKNKGGCEYIEGRIKYFEKNTNLFLQSGRIYSGLEFIKWYLKSNFIYFGLGTNIKENDKKITFFTSSLVWFERKLIATDEMEFSAIKQEGRKGIHEKDLGIDKNGIIINKIIECLFMLLTKTGYSEPIVELYKRLNEIDLINLKAGTLLSIIQALLKSNEKQLIEIAILQLKNIEPRHPIIEIVNKHLCRIQVLSKISETFNMNISDIQKLNGIEFEIFLENQFIKQNFKVERTKGSGDFGADLIIETTSGTRASIQAKRYKQKANLKAVQEVVASLAHYQTDFGIVITTSGFFQSAVDLAETNNVELWDEDKLIQFLSGDFDFSMLSKS